MLSKTKSVDKTLNTKEAPLTHLKTNSIYLDLTEVQRHEIYKL
jgi:hypothetical protein